MSQSWQKQAIYQCQSRSRCWNDSRHVLGTNFELTRTNRWTRPLQAVIEIHAPFLVVDHLNSMQVALCRNLGQKTSPTFTKGAWAQLSVCLLVSIVVKRVLLRRIWAFLGQVALCPRILGQHDVHHPRFFQLHLRILNCVSWKISCFFFFRAFERLVNEISDSERQNRSSMKALLTWLTTFLWFVESPALLMNSG